MIWLTLILTAMFFVTCLIVELVSNHVVKHGTELVGLFTLIMFALGAYFETSFIVWLVTDSGILK